MRLKTLFFSLILVLPLVGVLAACGGTPSTTTTNAPSPTTSTTGGSTPAATTAPTTAPTSPARTFSAIISTANKIVDGQMETVLVDMRGMTLYVNQSDTINSGGVCSGSCAKEWPPLIFNGSCTPTSTTPLTGQLSIDNDANGAQVMYQDHPLYTYIHDTQTFETNGNSTYPTDPWQVATPGMLPPAGPPFTPTCKQ